MVYPPSPYSVIADVRKEAGGIYSTLDLPDAEVTAKINAVDRDIDDATDHEETGWSNTEKQFPKIQEISKILSAASCRLRFEPEKAAAQRDFGLMMLQEVISEAGDAGLVAQTNEKQTFPSNPSAKWYGGRYVLTGLSEVAIDPDSIYEDN